jgi:hypothetical protein
MLGARSIRRRDCRHRLNALAGFRNNEPRAIVTQRARPIRVPDHADKTFDVLRKTR